MVCFALRSIRTLEGPEKQFKYVRPVNMNDPEDVRVSGMAADPPSRVEPDRLGDHHGISAIILWLGSNWACFRLVFVWLHCKLLRAASGDKSGKNLSEVLGPKAHCAAAIQRILHGMS